MSISSAIKFAHLLDKSSQSPKNIASTKKHQARLERPIRAPTKSQIPLSPRSVSTINLQITTSHEAARITNAEHRRTSVLLGQTQLAQHILRRPIASALWVFFEESLHHCGCDVAGGDGVDADAV